MTKIIRWFLPFFIFFFCLFLIGTAMSAVSEALVRTMTDTDNTTGFSDRVEAWRGDVIQALSINGLSTSDEMVDKVLRQIASESGGDPLAVQRISDINSNTPIPFNDGHCLWCSPENGNNCGDTNIGHGLMQTIPSTFWAYHLEGHEDIFDGYDNLLAALNYAKKRYGDNLETLGNGHGY